MGFPGAFYLPIVRFYKKPRKLFD